jgi:hypothetical protein
LLYHPLNSCFFLHRSTTAHLSLLLYAAALPIPLNPKNKLQVLS